MDVGFGQAPAPACFLQQARLLPSCCPVLGVLPSVLAVLDVLGLLPFVLRMLGALGVLPCAGIRVRIRDYGLS